MIIRLQSWYYQMNIYIKIINKVREGDGNPLYYSCLENPMDGGAWWAAVHGIAKSRTWLSDFPFTFHFPLSCIGEGNGNPLQCSCLENPRDGGAWWAALYGVAQSQTRLKRLSSSSSNKQSRKTYKNRNFEWVSFESHWHWKRISNSEKTYSLLRMACENITVKMSMTI